MVITHCTCFCVTVQAASQTHQLCYDASRINPADTNITERIILTTLDCDPCKKALYLVKTRAGAPPLYMR